MILASGSLRRQQFLRDLGLDFTVAVADIDETPLAGEAPLEMTLRLAAAKAAAVAARRQPAGASAIIVASDTTVAVDGVILGKPVDPDDAGHMLRLLRNRSHQVISAICLLRTGEGARLQRVNTTTVWMRDYTDQEIDVYVLSGDPLDKAGAYGIQHRGFNPVSALDGCYAGVMGLPLADFSDLLAQFGVRTPIPATQACSAFNTFSCCATHLAHSTHIDLPID
ncbi:MAG: septum formation protein Maf [Anaerolineales bacterium]|nr:septum formation protein Maf [Anaerolineales bacterium]